MNYSVLSVGLFIMILAFFIFSTPTVDPAKEQPAVGQAAQAGANNNPFTEGYCQQVDSEEVTFTAPRDENTKCPDGPGGSYKSGGIDPDNIFSGSTTYKLIRKNVPLNRPFFTKEDNSDHSTLASDVGIETELDPNQYRLYFPQISGEINLGSAPYSRTRHCGDRSYEQTGRMYFIDYGLAFGLVLKNGQPVEVLGTSITGEPATFWLTDVFKDVEREDELPAEAFACAGGTATATASTTPNPGSNVTIPNQQNSAAVDQLQLQYFIFGQPNSVNRVMGNVVNGWVDSCKPAVYLYPKERQLVNVKVFPKGELSYTEPLYDPVNGWAVEAYPNGSLFNSHNSSPITHNYLYYESKILDSEIKKPEKGWVVKYGSRVMGQESKQMKELFNEVLPKLGLNQKEQKDFMDYWLEKLPDSPYYFVGLIGKPQRDYLETLKVTPAPDTSIRFSLFFEALETPKNVEEPVINTPERNGFTLVDWGGMVKLHPGTPFTCSQ